MKYGKDFFPVETTTRSIFFQLLSYTLKVVNSKTLICDIYKIAAIWVVAEQDMPCNSSVVKRAPFHN